MFPERIETDRLELTALTPENVDVLEYYRVCSGNADPDFETVTEHLPWDAHDTPEETAEFLDRVADLRESDESADFAVRPRAGEPGAGEIAGACGLAVRWERRAGELGIWLRKPFWGRGYFGEAFADLARTAFDRLDLELVEILHRHGNDRSRRASEKFVDRWGGRHEGRFRNMWDGTDGPADAHRYTVTAAEFEAARDQTGDGDRAEVADR